MDNNYIKILKYLETQEIGQFININNLLCELFPLPDKPSEQEFHATCEKIRSILNFLALEKLIKFNGSIGFMNIGVPSHGLRKWLDDAAFQTYITTEGLNVLAAERNQKMVEQVNQSIIETNKAVQENYRSQNEIYKSQEIERKKNFRVTLVTVAFIILSAIFQGLEATNQGTEKELKLLRQQYLTRDSNLLLKVSYLDSLNASIQKLSQKMAQKEKTSNERQSSNDSPPLKKE